MNKTDRLLTDTHHRPYALPSGRWAYYQEWNEALFLHWKVAPATIQPLIPDSLTLDTFEGVAYVSLVAFRMQNIRTRHLPAISWISDFAEINVRTYIDQGHKKGVYFLSLEAEKGLSALIARQLSGLPYTKSSIHRDSRHYKSNHPQKGFHLDVAFEATDPITAKSKLDRWLTERYCAYFEEKERCYRYDIHHPEWPLRHVALHQMDLKYTIGSLALSDTPDLSHYSEGVQVLTWRKTKC